MRGAPSVTKQSQPLLHSHYLLIGNPILSQTDTEQLQWPFVQTLDMLCAIRVISAGDTVFWSAGT